MSVTLVANNWTMKISQRKSEYFAYLDNHQTYGRVFWLIQITDELQGILESFCGMYKQVSDVEKTLFLSLNKLNLQHMKIPEEEFNSLFESSIDNLAKGIGFIHANEEEAEWLNETYGGKDFRIVVATDGYFAIGSDHWITANPLEIEWFYNYCFSLFKR